MTSLRDSWNETVGRAAVVTNKTWKNGLRGAFAARKQKRPEENSRPLKNLQDYKKLSELNL